MPSHVSKFSSERGAIQSKYLVEATYNKYAFLN